MRAPDFTDDLAIVLIRLCDVGVLVRLDSGLAVLVSPVVLAVRLRQATEPEQEGEQVLLLEEQIERHVAPERDRAFASPIDLPRHVDGNRAPMRSFDRRAQHDGGGDLGDALGGKQSVANVPGRLLEGHAILVGELGSLDVEQRPKNLSLHGRRCVAASLYLQSRHRLAGRVARRRPIAQAHGGSKRGDFLFDPVARRFRLGLGPDARDRVDPDNLVERRPRSFPDDQRDRCGG